MGIIIVAHALCVPCRDFLDTISAPRVASNSTTRLDAVPNPDLFFPSRDCQGAVRSISHHPAKVGQAPRPAADAHVGLFGAPCA